MRVKPQAREMGPAGQLRAAALLVERAMRQLNLDEGECPSCRRRVFSNRLHAKVNEAVGQVPGRLRDAAVKLELDGREPGEED